MAVTFITLDAESWLQIASALEARARGFMALAESFSRSGHAEHEERYALQARRLHELRFRLLDACGALDSDGLRDPPGPT